MNIEIEVMGGSAALQKAIAERLSSQGFHAKPSQTFERVTEDRYYEMLGCVPPAIQMPKGFLVGEPMDHCPATGRPRYDAFIEKDDAFYFAGTMTAPAFKEMMKAEGLDK